MYRGRNDGRTAFVRRQVLDNIWVVPYNPYLLAKFDCHINVEICVGVTLIKYLYKYVCKGTNKIAFNVLPHSQIPEHDEITAFQSAQWSCAPEAMWRIYAFVLSKIYPPVIQLHIHLPNKQHVLFSPSRYLPKRGRFISIVKGKLVRTNHRFMYLCCNHCHCLTSAEFSLLVFDETGEIDVTVFGKEGDQLLNISADDFWQKDPDDFSSVLASFKSHLEQNMLKIEIQSKIFHKQDGAAILS